MQSAGTDWGAPFPFPNRVCRERSKVGPLTATMTEAPPVLPAIGAIKRYRVATSYLPSIRIFYREQGGCEGRNWYP